MDHDPIRQVEELQRQIDELRAELAESRTPTAPLGGADASPHPERVAANTPEHHVATTTGEPAPTGTRRNLLRLAAAGAAAGGVAAVTATTGRAAAADSDPIEVGAVTTQGDTARTRTVLSYINAEPPRTSGTLPGTFTNANIFLVRDTTGLPIGLTYASSDPAAVAGYGTAVVPNGVFGRSSVSGGHGVVAAGTVAGAIGLLARGSRANARLAPDGDPPASRTDSHEAGELIADANGDLWYCEAGGTPGTWVKLNEVPAGPGGPVTGTFTPITPARVFDSRIPAIPNSGILTPNSNRLISVHDGRDINSGAVNAPNVVPPSASAIAFNVTVAQTTGNNFLTVAPGNAAGITASTINWSGVNLANGSIVGIDNQRRVRVFTGPNAGANCHCILDVTGYFT